MPRGKIVTVSPEIRARVRARADQCIKLAENHFGRQYEPVNISYDLRGTTAGTFQPGTRNVNFNSVLLTENVDNFIHRTVAHEVAHYIHNVNASDEAGSDTVRYFGHYMQSGRRMKRDIHGVAWQRIMVLFGAPVSRTHSYDVSNAKIKRKTYKVKCSGCGEIREVSSQRYNRILRGAKYHIVGHTSCGHLVPTHAKGGVALKPEIDPNDPWVDFPPPRKLPWVFPPTTRKVAAAPKAKSAQSKLDRCKELYKKYFGSSRATMIREFINQAGCTPAGAATYYVTCANLYGR